MKDEGVSYIEPFPKNLAAFFGISLFAALLFSCVYVRAENTPGGPRAGETGKSWNGLEVYKPAKCYAGYTLFAPAQSGVPTPLSPVFLIDMRGEVAHQWMVETPAFHPRLMPDGSLFYHTTISAALRSEAAYGLYELDPRSNVTWHLPGDISHDFQVINNDAFLISEHDEGEPEIKIVTRANKVLWTWKSVGHIGELEQLTGLKINPAGDWAHNNNASFLGETRLAERDPRFKKGNILFSFCNLDTIGIIDYPSGRIVWAWGKGVLSEQHSPEMQSDGHILIFDNGKAEKRSRVLEVDPLSGRVVWEYPSKSSGSFYSEKISNATRLPNGNTLICDGTNSRIFEVTPEGETVWEFKSPFNDLNNGSGIYRAYRYSKEYVKPLLDSAKDPDK